MTPPKQPQGNAADALDFALDHIQLASDTLQFLENWRAYPHNKPSDNWERYITWLQTQRAGAALATHEAARANDPLVGQLAEALRLWFGYDDLDEAEFAEGGE